MQNIPHFYTTPGNRPVRFEPSEKFSERKRALFPTQDSDSDNDLGHISPLEISSSPERFQNVLFRKSSNIESKYVTLSDSDLEEYNNTKENVNPNIHSEKKISPKTYTNNQNENKEISSILAPNTPPQTDAPENDLSSSFVPETPVKESPTQILKTPHDTSSSNLELPRLVRKSLLDISNIDKSNMKRKSDSPAEITEKKNSKLDQSVNKVSKARTALFTETILPAKSFYPKTETNKPEVNIRHDTPSQKKRNLRKQPAIYLCNRRKSNSRRYSGQINAGVRHGIKKPKHKLKLTKVQLRKAIYNYANDSSDNLHLNTIRIEDKKKEKVSVVSTEQLQKMDSILKNINSNNVIAKPLSVLMESNKIKNVAPVKSGTVELKTKTSLKRPLSPQSEVKKKFFKSCPSIATVTINPNIKLKVDQGGISLIEKQKKTRKSKFEDIDFDTTDLSLPEEKIINESFTDILRTLDDDDKNCEDLVLNPDAALSNNFTLTAYTSVAASENSILLHTEPYNNYNVQIIDELGNGLVQNNFVQTISNFEGQPNIIIDIQADNQETNNNTQELLVFNPENISEPTTAQNIQIVATEATNNMLLSPTSLVCDLTSGLALDSPKSQTDQNIDLQKLNSSKKRISFTENMSDERKLFPIFCGNQNTQIASKNPPKESKHIKNIKKIWKPLSDNQTLIDAGQKKFGVTQCPDCKVVYSLGEPEDEIMHHNFHNAVGVLKYSGWKHERVVNQTHKGKVIQINPTDPKSWWRKVKELLVVINDELGFVDIHFDTSNKKVFLYITNKQIVGCLVAEPKSQAHKMLSQTEAEVDHCTEETYPVKCGVSRIWVAITHRKQGVATCLMNALRSQFIYGHILSTSEIAFSAPTEAGKLFAQKYTKTESYLIYTS